MAGSFSRGEREFLTKMQGLESGIESLFSDSGRHNRSTRTSWPSHSLPLRRLANEPCLPNLCAFAPSREVLLRALPCTFRRLVSSDPARPVRRSLEGGGSRSIQTMAKLTTVTNRLRLLVTIRLRCQCCDPTAEYQALWSESMRNLKKFIEETKHQAENKT